MRRLRPTPSLVLLPLLLASARAQPSRQDAPPAAAPAPAALRSEPLAVVKVVDGDTLHVLRDGVVEKLRLLSVDTEEKLLPGATSSATKPQTVFGEETAVWARELFAGLGSEEEPARVRLLFPGEREERDIYGRLLCHVLLPDGRDFNLLLVREGKSPYFNKYGNSRILHEQFLAAQADARARGVGIWDPATNRPEDPDAPGARRPYEQLLPWWDARAAAIDGFRRRQREEPEGVVAAEDPDALQAVVDAGQAVVDAGQAVVEVFGAPSAMFDEDDGSLTVLFRGADRSRALRVRVAAEDRPAHASLELRSLLEELRQNYVWVRGRLTWGGRGFELRSRDPAQWRRAGPEPR